MYPFTFLKSVQQFGQLRQCLRFSVIPFGNYCLTRNSSTVWLIEAVFSFLIFDIGSTVRTIGEVRSLGEPCFVDF
jgi:hypothetical protein